MRPRSSTGNRSIIQERLHPLKELTNARDVAQVLLGVACGTSFTGHHNHVILLHRWLYERASILHRRDLNPNDVMYRIIKGKVYRVLTGHDLTSWNGLLTSDYTKMS